MPRRNLHNDSPMRNARSTVPLNFGSMARSRSRSTSYDSVPIPPPSQWAKGEPPKDNVRPSPPDSSARLSSVSGLPSEAVQAQMEAYFHHMYAPDMRPLRVFLINLLDECVDMDHVFPWGEWPVYFFSAASRSIGQKHQDVSGVQIVNAFLAHVNQEVTPLQDTTQAAYKEQVRQVIAEETESFWVAGSAGYLERLLNEAQTRRRESDTAFTHKLLAGSNAAKINLLALHMEIEVLKARIAENTSKNHHLHYQAGQKRKRRQGRDEWVRKGRRQGRLVSPPRARDAVFVAGSDDDEVLSARPLRPLRKSNTITSVPSSPEPNELSSTLERTRSSDQTFNYTIPPYVPGSLDFGDSSSEEADDNDNVHKNREAPSALEEKMRENIAPISLSKRSIPKGIRVNPVILCQGLVEDGLATYNKSHGFSSTKNRKQLREVLGRPTPWVEPSPHETPIIHVLATDTHGTTFVTSLNPITSSMYQLLVKLEDAHESAPGVFQMNTFGGSQKHNQDFAVCFKAFKGIMDKHGRIFNAARLVGGEFITCSIFST